MLSYVLSIECELQINKAQISQPTCCQEHFSTVLREGEGEGSRKEGGGMRKEEGGREGREEGESYYQLFSASSYPLNRKGSASQTTD